MNIQRRGLFQLLALPLALSALGLATGAQAQSDGDAGFRAGKVFTSSNAVDGNELLVYGSDTGGALSLQARLATQGTGSGAGLGNQGAVTLSRDGRFVFVVNASSHSVSTFQVRRAGLMLVSTVASGGEQPVSVTERNGLVYVLNAGGTGNVAGFRNMGGTLHALSRSVRGLSAASGTAAAQVGFSPDGMLLVVTEKGTNKLTTYPVGYDGRIAAPVVSASAGATPFGFAFDWRGYLLVSEAFGGAPGASAVSSYRFDDWTPATPITLSASVGTTQTAACWVVVTPSGRFAYATNTGSGTVSRYNVHRSGAITLGEAVAATSGAGPIDAAISANGSRLHVLNAGSHALTSFTIAKDGGLTALGSVGEVPAGSTGLAAN